MPLVTIEQNPESRQTYFRLTDVARLLDKPQFRISRDSNEMLGPEGWKNQFLVNEAPQCLDESDLLLEIDSRLINYIEPGQALEIHIDELDCSERVLPPPLYPYPTSKSPVPAGAKVYPFKKAFYAPPSTDTVLKNLENALMERPPKPRPGGHDEHQERHEDGAGHRTPVVEGPDERIHDGSGSRDRFEGGKDSDGLETDDGTVPVKFDDEIDPPDPGDEKGFSAPIDDDEIAEEEKGDDADKPDGRGGWVRIAAAILVGLVIGFFGKYIYDEYAPFGSGNSLSPTQVARQKGLLQTDAFAPLSDNLAQVANQSPLGLTPERLPDYNPMNPNQAAFFYNYGAKKAQQGAKPEAAYWYKRAVKTMDLDALTFLGDAYMNGDGLPRDTRTGFQLLRLAAGLGGDKARNYVIELLEAGSVPNAPSSMAQAYRPR